MNRKGKWKTLQAGNSEPSNASTHDVRVGGGGGGVEGERGVSREQKGEVENTSSRQL